MNLLAKKSGTHSQNASLVNHVLVPMNNILRDLKGLDEQVLAPLEVFVNNNDLRDTMANKADQVDFENLLMLELTHSFLVRDMVKVQLLVELIKTHITKRPLVFNYVIIDFYVGLFACYSARELGDSEIPDVQKICDKLKWMVGHSVWNFENKYLLLKAEYHFTRGEIDAASESYNAAIVSAIKHKFLPEQALACELAGYFYIEQGDETKSRAMFKQARDAYIEWGAEGKAESLPQFLSSLINM